MLRTPPDENGHARALPCPDSIARHSHASLARSFARLAVTGPADPQPLRRFLRFFPCPPRPLFSAPVSGHCAPATTFSRIGKSSWFEMGVNECLRE